MSSPQRKYDDSESEGDDFNPAPADLSDDERQRDEPESPVRARNDARRSSVSRDDEDGDVDGDANGDAHSVNGRDNKDDDEGGNGDEDEDDIDGRRKARDDDEDDDDDDDEDDEDDDDDDMPVRATTPARPAYCRLLPSMIRRGRPARFPFVCCYRDTPAN